MGGFSRQMKERKRNEIPIKPSSAATAAAPEFVFQPGFTICFCLQCDKLGFGLFSSHCNVAATASRFQKTVSSTVDKVSFEFMKRAANVV